MQSREAAVRGAAAGLDGIVRAVATLAADATEKAISIIINKNGLHSPLCSNISNGLHSPPRNSSSRKCICGSHRSGNYSSSRDHQDILAVGDHRAYVFVAASPDIYTQNVELYLQHRTLPRRMINRPTTLRLLLEITRLLLENTDT